MGHAAEAVAIDIDKPHLGLGDDVTVAAAVMLAPEAGLKGLRYAQDLGVPYLNINAALTESGPELAMFAHRATAAPVVLTSHWMAGAATGVPDVRFHLVNGESSSRRRGGEAATEIVVEIEGEADGRTKRSRSMLEFKHGTASLTGLSVGIGTERSFSCPSWALPTRTTLGYQMVLG